MTYQKILDAINQNIKQNGKEEITGDVMNAVLKLLLDFINKQTKDYKGYNGFITENSRPNNVRSGYWLANSGVYSNFGVEVSENHLGVVYWNEDIYVADEIELINEEVINEYLNNKVVHLYGDEVIYGNKEFTSPILNPIVPTDNNHLANKKYVDETIDTKAIQRIDTEENWMNDESILYAGEIALVEKNGKLFNVKFGDGTKKFSELPYMYKDGSSLFTWVKYADTPTSGMSDYPDNKLYIGLAYNKVTATESNNYSDYSWSLMPQNIEIGGRNLILNSKSLEGLTDIYGGVGSAVMHLSVKLEKDKEYIFTYKNNNDIPRAEINTITLRNANGETIQEIQTIGDGSPTIFKVTTVGVVGIYFYSLWKNANFSFRELMLTSGNKIVDWMPAPEDVEASILQSKTDSITASKAYSDAHDELKRIQAEAYADGKVTAAEQRAIDDATAKAEAAKLYATAQDDLLRVQLEAYSDGQITAEEQQRIQQMQDNLAAAKAYADAQANLAKIAANAYADGVIDEEEARAIADATAKMEAAKLHAQGLVNNIQIGGRNLILNSKSLEGLTDIYGGVGSAVMHLSVKLEKDKEYIFTYKNNNDIPRAEINTITLRNANGETIQEIQTIGDGSPTIFKVTTVGVVGIYFYSLWKNANFSFRELMLTSGNKIVDWMPAPEDVDNAINDVKIKAENALTQLTSIANDDILSPSEKQQVANEWNRIKSEYTSNYSLAVNNGVSTINFTDSYNDLNSYISPLLVNLATDSSIVGDVFRTKFKAYYDQNIALLVLISNKFKSGIDKNTTDLINANNAIDRVNKITSFLGTTVDNNVVATGLLMVGSGSQSNAGISGLNEAGEKSVRLWAGGTAQNRDKAAWNTLDDGTMQFFHPNGNIAFRFGLSNGKFIMDGYHEQGMKLWELSPNRGLVNVAYIPESWTNTPMININQSSSTLNVANAQSFLSSLILEDFIYPYEENLKGAYSWYIERNFTSFEYQIGTHPDNQQYEPFIGYKSVENSKTLNVQNGWYGLQIGVLSFRNGDYPPPRPLINYVLYYIENGKVIKSQNINF